MVAVRFSLQSMTIAERDIVARPGAYACCDGRQRPSPSREPLPSKVMMKSCEAPKNERLRLEREAEAELRETEPGSRGESSTSHAVAIPTQPSRNGDGTSRSTKALSSSYNSTREVQRPKTRMSIDPAPVSQVLQMASSATTNFFSGTTAIPQPQPVPQPYPQPYSLPSAYPLPIIQHDLHRHPVDQRYDAWLELAFQRRTSSFFFTCTSTLMTLRNTWLWCSTPSSFHLIHGTVLRWDARRFGAERWTRSGETERQT